MNLQFPNHESLITSRNILLQSSLRPEPLPYGIEEEYPLVLNSTNINHSYCFVKNDEVITHANLYPKTIFLPGSNPIKIGLIGNVATHPDFRGQGAMKTMFQKIETVAQSQKLNGLILWSDLLSFYQKLGYSSFGEEIHFYLSKQKIPRNSKNDVDIKLVKPESLRELIPKFITLRYHTPITFERSEKEWLQLCQIPDTYIFTIIKQKKITGYFIMGRGFDMVGVIHEWGCETPTDFVAAVGSILHLTKLEECTLLSPSCLAKDWRDSFSDVSSKKDHQALCLFKNLNLNPLQVKDLGDLFIWGLDSI